MSRPARASLAEILTRRLAWIAAAVTLVNVVFVALYYGADLEGLRDEMMETEMMRLEAGLSPGEDGALTLGEARLSLFRRHPDAYAYALLDADGRIVEAQNLALIPGEALATGMFADDWLSRVPGEGGGTTLVASHVVGAADPDVRVVFVAAADPANLTGRALFGEFVGHIWLPLLPIALLLIGGNAIMIRRGLAPVRQAARWARGIRPGAPPPDIALEDVPAEIADLVEATERSLDRLNAALAAEKRRAAEAAHALRTPLAVLIARLDALPPGETADRLRTDLSSLSRTVRQLLDSASADTLVVGEGRAVDLAEAAEAVVASLAPFAIARGIDLELVSDAGAERALGEREAVELAIANLVENAVLHGGRGGQVRVTVGPGPAVAVLDRGGGLPEGAADALFRPFWRGEDAPTGGAGLGLAIVERVQRAHGGTVEAANAEGGGALFRLLYRAASAAA